MPEAAHEPDATAEFYSVLQDPSRWVIKPGVPVFKSHQRKDPATQNLIVVDEPKLHRIAANMQRLERDGGVPIRMTLGHTEPGKPENQQPPIGGYYRNPRVGKFGPRGESAIMVDEWLDPQYAQMRKNYPYRSAEYYDDAEQITGVALLTRDPYLDLGVVAYQRGEPQGQGFLRRDVPFLSCTEKIPGPVQYDRFGRQPVMYRYTIRDLPMFPQNGPPNPQAPQYPQAPQPQYAPGPVPAPQYAAPQPTPYAAPAPVPQMPRPNPTPYGWRPNYYATEPPSIGGDPGMGGPPGGGGDGMQALVQALQAAVQIAQSMMESSSVAPQAPFPGGGGGPDGGMVPNARYGRNNRYADNPPPERPNFGRPQQRPGMGRPQQRPDMGRPQQPDPRGQYARYERDTQPAATTISGMPVGYQMKLDQLTYQNQELTKAMQVLMYERDQADTQECVAEIRRLASMGFPVDEQEIAELKKQPREHRAQYLDRIASKYQRVGTENPPPILGDPTPGPADAPGGNRPASREEMDAALKLAGNSKDPNAFTAALNYVRNGGNPNGQPTHYNRMQMPGAEYAWADGANAPNGFPPSFVDPYEPSSNGQH